MNAIPSNADPSIPVEPEGPGEAAAAHGAVSRRDFLSALRSGLLWLSGLLACGGLVRFLSYQPDPPPRTEFDLGPAESYSPGTRTVIPDAQTLLIRTAAEFVALSLVCPHLGCQVQPGAAGFACACHGSRFDGGGALQRGPAQKPLRARQLEQAANGHLILHID